MKKKKKKICIPIGYGHGKADSLRTLYDLNVIFADVNVNEYDTVGGYGCKPFYGLNSGHGGGHGSHGSNHHTGSHHGSNHNTGSLHGSNHNTGSHHGSTNYGGSHTGTDTDSAVDSDYDYVNQNDHGALIQTDDYDQESNAPSHGSDNSHGSDSSHGSHNLFGGLFHGNPSHNYNHGNPSSNHNQGNGYASGGPLGFFGQGGLFDFSNSGGQRPQVSGALGDSIDDTVKPVIEINVPDTIQDVVSLI